MTIGTRLFTWMRGELVGEDGFGNCYFHERRAPEGRRRRRWVLYEGAPEGSAVPAEWNAWLQHRADAPPADGAARRPWQRAHIPNLTGTAQAYRPPGDLARGTRAEGVEDERPEGERREGVDAPYQPWRP